MLRFVCVHCQADLGEALPESPEPACVDHPNGTVTIIEVEDGDS